MSDPVNDLRLAMRAVSDGTGGALRGVVSRYALRGSALEFVEEFLCPLLRRIGDGWIQGGLGVAEEHLASQVLRDVLGEVTWAARPDPPAPGLLCTTPPDQRHEFGALIAAYVACHAEWRAVYAGPDLPLAEVARLASGHEAVALSILQPPSQEGVRGDLEELRQAVSPQNPIYVGGRPEVLAAARAVEGVTGLASFTEFSRALQAERNGPRRP